MGKKLGIVYQSPWDGQLPAGRLRTSRLPESGLAVSLVSILNDIRSVNAPLPAIDQRAFRDALGRFVTGVTVVTACSPAGEYVGLTVNSFNSVSLDPPLIVWSLSVESPNLPIFERASHYAVNVLALDQVELSQRFASRIGNKFGGLQICEGFGNAPLLPGCCAWFECRNEIRHSGGDHLLFIGYVERFSHADREPLVYHAGRYRALRQLGEGR